MLGLVEYLPQILSRQLRVLSHDLQYLRQIGVPVEVAPLSLFLCQFPVVLLYFRVLHEPSHLDVVLLKQELQLRLLQCDVPLRKYLLQLLVVELLVFAEVERQEQCVQVLNGLELQCLVELLVDGLQKRQLGLFLSELLNELVVTDEVRLLGPATHLHEVSRNVLNQLSLLAQSVAMSDQCVAECVQVNEP